MLKKCKVCGSIVEMGKGNRQTCSSECSKEFKKQWYATRNRKPERIKWQRKYDQRLYALRGKQIRERVRQHYRLHPELSREYSRNYRKLHKGLCNIRRYAYRFLRETVFERDGYACVYCGSQKYILLHHKKYLPNGKANRIKQIKELETVCKKCHKLRIHPVTHPIPRGRA